MNRAELEAFLATVRRTRFIDYLDPLGETAQAAFERRLQWARVSQHDPAYAEEALFLLRHEQALRSTLIDELAEDDWVEDGGSDFQYGGKSWVEEDRKSNAIFHAVELTDEHPRELTDEVMVEEDEDDPPSISAPALMDEPVAKRVPTPRAMPPRAAAPMPSLRRSTILPDEPDPDSEEDTQPPSPVRTAEPAAPAAPRPSIAPAGVLPRGAPPEVGPVRDDDDDFSDEGALGVRSGSEELATAPSAMIRSRRPDPAPQPAPLAPPTSRFHTPAPAPSKVAPPKTPPPAPLPKITVSERPQERSGPPMAGLAGVGIVLITVLGLGGAWATGMLGGGSEGPEVTEPTPAPRPAATAPAPAPVAAQPDPTPAQPEPVPKISRL